LLSKDAVEVDDLPDRVEGAEEQCCFEQDERSSTLEERSDVDVRHCTVDHAPVLEHCLHTSHEVGHFLLIHLQFYAEWQCYNLIQDGVGKQRNRKVVVQDSKQPIQDPTIVPKFIRGRDLPGISQRSHRIGRWREDERSPEDQRRHHKASERQLEPAESRTRGFDRRAGAVHIFTRLHLNG
jgi:hypothetical protein